MNKSTKNNVSSFAIVVSTYNNVDALRLCLYSISRQTYMPDEVIIADDGSRSDTKQVIEKFKKILPINHIWQPDKGFRKSLILNKAFSNCKSDYIIQIDGDIMLDCHFCEDHVNSARHGYFLQGSRGLLDKASTESIFKKEKYIPHFYMRGLHHRLNTLRIPFLTPFFYNYNHLRGCNMSFWRNDLIAINGYDNNMEGYWHEDDDITIRLLRSGVKKRFLKFKAIEYHLWHKEAPSKNSETVAKKRYAYNYRQGIVRVEDGMMQSVNK